MLAVSTERRECTAAMRTFLAANGQRSSRLTSVFLHRNELSHALVVPVHATRAEDKRALGILAVWSYSGHLDVICRRIHTYIRVQNDVFR